MDVLYCTVRYVCTYACMDVCSVMQHRIPSYPSFCLCTCTLIHPCSYVDSTPLQMYYVHVCVCMHVWMHPRIRVCCLSFCLCLCLRCHVSSRALIRVPVVMRSCSQWCTVRPKARTPHPKPAKGTGMVGAESVYTAPVTLLSGCKSRKGTSMDGHVDFKSQ